MCPFVRPYARFEMYREQTAGPDTYMQVDEVRRTVFIEIVNVLRRHFYDKRFKPSKLGRSYMITSQKVKEWAKAATVKI